MSLSWPKVEAGPQEPARGNASPVRSVYRRQPYRVHSQITSATPHSVSLWAMVSFSPHSVQSSVSTSRILCSLVFVSSKSWSTIYRADLATSDFRMLWRLFHTLSHSIPGWICVACNSRGRVAAVVTHLRVPYTRHLTFWRRNYFFLILAHCI